jgi:hypothetical protein
MLVIRVAEREDCVREILKTRKVLQAELLEERLDSVRRITFAIGAGDEDSVALFGESGCGVAFMRDERYYVAFGFEFLCKLAGKAFGGAGLTGVEDGYLE